MQQNNEMLNLHSGMLRNTLNMRLSKTKQFARKTTGTKTCKRRRVAENNNLDDSFEESYEEIGELFDDDREARRKTRTSFQRMEMPSEYCETHYYASISINRPDIVLDNKFWFDCANHLIEKKSFKNFLSGNFVLVSSNISEIIFSCAVLDLPFNSCSHIIKPFDDKGIKIKLEGNAMLFKKEIKKAVSEIENNIHVIHRYFEYGNEQSEKKIKEFLVHQVYCCEVIITNVSNKSKEFQLLWQIPEGSLPLLNITYQKSENHKLEPYSTTTFKYHFYFPSEGSFIHFPSNVSIQDKVVAVSNVQKFKVVSYIKEVVIETFKDILMTGDKNAIYEFIKTSNLLQDKKGFSFQLIFWMLKEKDVFEQIISILRERRIFVQTVWEFGFFHKDIQAIKEYISRSDKLCNIIGSNFKSSLYENFITKFKPRHLEYFPLVNSRAHNCGDQNRAKIRNNEFRRQYNAYLVNSIEKNRLENPDKMCFAYFLLLQDRINEAIEIFQQVKRDEIIADGSLELQYDYMSAYLDFYIGGDTNYSIARGIAEKYKDYPILHWKYLFEEIQDQLVEYDGIMELDHEINQEEEDVKDKNLKKSKELEPYLSAELKNKKIHVDFANIQSIDIKYYIIDPEILFSRAPFIMQDAEDFAFVKPSETVSVILNPANVSESIELEKSLINENMIIEVSGEGKQIFLRYFSTSLKVHINENYGELKVTDKDNISLPQVYIKVFSKCKTGEVKFFRDGYTDINGKYEYAQINSKNINDVEKFAIFVKSDDFGSVTKECIPPQTIEKNEIDSWNANPLSFNKKMYQKIRHLQNKV